MAQDLHVRLPENLGKRLEEVKIETGLSKSEIARRGILEQVKELNGDK